MVGKLGKSSLNSCVCVYLVTNRTELEKPKPFYIQTRSSTDADKPV